MTIRRNYRIWSDARSRIRKRRKFHPTYVPALVVLRCCICMSDFETICDEKSQTMSLSEIDSRHLEEYQDQKTKRLRDDVLVSFPCKVKEHTTCISCLRKLVQQRCQSGSSQISCMFPYSVCQCKETLSIDDISLCFNPMELSRLRLRSEGHRFTCCGQTLRTSDSSHGLATCRTCTKRFCTSCWSCTNFLDKCCCGAPVWDRFFRDKLTGKLRQLAGITVKERDDMVRAIKDQPIPTVTCPGCGAKIEKTSDCNCLSHCGYQICWVCNYAADVIPSWHFQSCPRYDQDFSEFPCRQGDCYDHDRECTVSTHKRGRLKYHEFRRSKMIQSIQNCK